ncbi:MAG: hypothetical protein ABFS56_14900, partial [Pseudomonadota bacterium]
GFTDWLAMNLQDIECLGWSFIMKQKKQTAGGFACQVNFYLNLQRPAMFWKPGRSSFGGLT